MEIAGDKWQDVAADRVTWAALEEKFVQHFDAPWASGEQLELNNLAPNRPSAQSKPKRRKKVIK